MLGVAKLSTKAGGPEPAWRLPHIRLGRITSEEPGRDGIASDMAAIRQLYTKAVSAAETAWESAAAEGKPDVPAALHAVEGLADAVTQNRTALVALTAMRNYDNYTFTHMVNVSILTMGQARALGIEGRLLREFGLSALMHDIGKVRTPKDILQKPERLTEQEFVIMRRHPVEGAEILRRTPEMPILAPVVAFEHHLRLDGTGYPDGAKRSALNLGTMICSIADVYDAMRSQRAYQQAFPTDRVLAVLKKDDGAHFDAQLVRRFVQLLGIYPPGTLVKLASDAVAVVTRVHAPDPYRPRVKVLLRRRRRALRRATRAQPVGADARRRAGRQRRRRRSIRRSTASIRSTSSMSCARKPAGSCEQLYLPSVTEGLRTIAVAGCGLAIGFAWQAIRTSLIPPSSPDRLVSELRLGQFAALLLTMTAGVYIGFAVAHEARAGCGLRRRLRGRIPHRRRLDAGARSATGADRPRAGVCRARRPRRRPSSRAGCRMASRRAGISIGCATLRRSHWCPLLSADPETMTYMTHASISLRRQPCWSPLRSSSASCCALVLLAASRRDRAVSGAERGAAEARRHPGRRSDARRLSAVVRGELLRRPGAAHPRRRLVHRGGLSVPQHDHVRRPLDDRHRLAFPIATG